MILARRLLFACGLALVGADACSDRVDDGEELDEGESPAPTCRCNEGFDNTEFALYCCPTDGSDPSCA